MSTLTIDEEYQQLVKGQETRLWAKLEIQASRFKKRLVGTPRSDTSGSPSESFSPAHYGRVCVARELLRRKGEL